MAGVSAGYGEPRPPAAPRGPNDQTAAVLISVWLDSSSSTPENAQLHNVPTSAGRATCQSAADGLANHWKLASKAPQNLDAKMKEMIAIEVDWIGTMIPSPRNTRQAATSTERA